MPEIVVFAFYGRRANVEIQLPFIRRILAGHPEVRFDAWNLARNERDRQYVQSLPEARDGYSNWDDIWRHYAGEEYRDTIFVKLDDDVVFLEAERFEELIRAVRQNPGAIISAQVINNGASHRVDPELWGRVKELAIPLQDFHACNYYAEMSHQWFFDNWLEVTDGPVELTPAGDWLSINCIAFDRTAAKFIGDGVGTPSPPHIAGKDWPPGFPLGDEGAANILPCYVLRGMVAAHLTFGPQNCTDEQQDRWRDEYARIAKEYLER